MGYKTEEPMIAPWINRDGADREDGVGNERGSADGKM
jgi:hypothetical protein